MSTIEVAQLEELRALLDGIEAQLQAQSAGEAGVFAAPPGLPPNVVTGELITSVWGNQVVAALTYAYNWAVGATSYVSTVASGGPIDATSLNAWGTWLNVGAFLVPSWATHMHVDLTVQGIQCIVADSDYMLRTTCNQAGAEALYSGFLNRYTSYRCTGRFAVTPGISNTVLLEAKRVGGTGGLRYAPGASIVGTVIFRPS